MNLSTLQKEELSFLRRLEDLSAHRQAVPRFTSFLTPRQKLIAEAFIEQRQIQDIILFYGGFSDAMRCVLGFFSSHNPPNTVSFPIHAVTAHYRAQDCPSHRDFLGACTALQIARESIGDIVLDEKHATIFLLAPVDDVLLQELRQVGRCGVRCEPGICGNLVVRQEYTQVRGTVPSPRLDCLISILTGLSREKSAKLIQSERVQLNHVVIESISREFSAGDTVSVRGFGKAIVDEIGKPTRKGRLPILLRKFK